jgi:hypothetical protein
MKIKFILIAAALLILAGAVGCDTLDIEIEKTSNDPVGIMNEFIDAYNDKNENLMIELSTTKIGQIIKDGNFINNGLWGMKYANLDNASIHRNDSEDRVTVLCSWDRATLEEAEKASSLIWSFASLVKENGQWKVAGVGSSGN